MDPFSGLFVLLLIGAFVIRIVYWVWMVVAVGRTVQGAYQVYNAHVEAGLRQLAVAIQAQQAYQARALQQAMRRQVDSLPRHERAVYRDRLSEVVTQRKVLNPATGEWESH